MSYEVGSAFLQILPSFSGVVEAISAEAEKWGDTAAQVFAETFKGIVNGELKNLSPVKVTADISEAEAKLAEIRASLDGLGNERIGVTLSEADALAKIETLRVDLDELALKSPNIRVDIDAARAEVELAALSLEAGTLGSGLNDVEGAAGGAGAGVSGLGADAESSMPEVSGLVAGVVALGVALVPIGGLALGALAALPALIAGATAGLGGLVLGFSGIFGTLSAFNKSQTTGGSAGSSGASSALSNADAERNAANSVQTAEEALTNSRVNGARSVAAAQAAAAQATVSANQAVITAENNLVNAERAVTQAQWNEQQAQEAVITARQNAQNQLENYTNQLADGAIAQQQAALNLVEAKQALDAANAPGSTATDNQKTQAQISFEQATQAVTDLNTQQSQLAVTATAAAAAGVDGNNQVLAAEHNLQQATQAVTDAVTAQGTAQQNVADATAAAAAQQITNQDNIAQAQKKSAQTVADAERALTMALDNQKSAFERAAIPVSSGSSAINTYANDLKKLTPAGREFVEFVTGTMYPVFEGLKAQVQDAFLPKIQGGLMDLLPFFRDLGPIIVQAASGIGQTFEELAKFIGSKTGLSEVMTIFKEGNGFMAAMGGNFVTLFEAFTGVGAQAGPIVTALSDGITHLVDSFAKWAEDGGFQKFLVWLKENGPSIVSDIGDLLKSAGGLVVALTPIGLVLDKVIGGLSQFVGWLVKSDPILLTVTAQLGALALAVLAVSSPVVLITAGIALLVIGVTELVVHWRAVWGDIKNWALDAWRFLDGQVFSPIVNFFTALPDEIAKGLVGLADTIARPFEDALGPIKAVIDTIKGWIGGLSTAIGLTTVKLDATQAGSILGVTIPKHHDGGVVQGTPGVETLAWLMPGEIVTPAGMKLPSHSDARVITFAPVFNGVDLSNVNMVQREITSAFAQFAEEIQPMKIF